jgi:hypothetical protein
MAIRTLNQICWNYFSFVCWNIFWSGLAVRTTIILAILTIPVPLITGKARFLAITTFVRSIRIAKVIGNPVEFMFSWTSRRDWSFLLW